MPFLKLFWNEVPYLPSKIRGTKARNRNESKEEILCRVQKCFLCRVVVISREEHKGPGYHLNVAIWNQNAYKQTATKILRSAFPEFDGAQWNVIFDKAWAYACKYVIQEDEDILKWGQHNLEQVKEAVNAQKNHRANP